MFTVYNKLTETWTAEDFRADAEQSSALDFYTHDAVPTISWMQDAFKTEQR